MEKTANWDNVLRSSFISDISKVHLQKTQVTFSIKPNGIILFNYLSESRKLLIRGLFLPKVVLSSISS